RGREEKFRVLRKQREPVAQVRPSGCRIPDRAKLMSRIFFRPRENRRGPCANLLRRLPNSRLCGGNPEESCLSVSACLLVVLAFRLGNAFDYGKVFERGGVARDAAFVRQLA